jgi:hypothetical protein
MSSFELVLDKPLTAKFIGEDWSVWKGPADGNGLEGEEDCVPEPDEIDFENIILETHLKKGEKSISGEEKMRRARQSKNLQLGGRAFVALWTNWQGCKAVGKPEKSVLEKLRRAEKIGNVVYFFGLVLRDQGGNRYVLYLYFDGREWDWNCYWLDDRWRVGRPSISIASIN